VSSDIVQEFPLQQRPLRIATRASRLALWQAEHVAALLGALPTPVDVEIVEISTVGDRDLSSPLASMGGQGVFTREVQRAVLEDRCDIAVHSLKDLPTDATGGLMLAGIPLRAPRYDVLLVPDGSKVDRLDALPRGATVATGSPRRQSQLRAARPDLNMCDVRGNVETRLGKLDAREFDAMILASAGLQRLGIDRPTIALRPPLMLPAVGQAALGIECRTEDTFTCNVLGKITHSPTEREVTAERACLRTLRAGCHAPVGTLCTFIDEAVLRLEAAVLSLDGSERVSIVDVCDVANVEDADALGVGVAEQLLQAGAERLILGT